MARGEFEKELEYYIAQRRKAKIKFSGIFSPFKSRKKMPETALPPEIQKYDATSPAEPAVSIPGEDDSGYQPKKGVFTRMLEGLGLVSAEKEEKPADIPAEEVRQMLVKDDITQDTKEIAKIALAAIKHLPPEQLTAFKSGPEFARLKELLKKHSLIK
jgi:hypothetical protein